MSPYCQRFRDQPKNCPASLRASRCAFGQRCALALRALSQDAIRRPSQIEVEAEFFGHHLEIVDLHLRSELLPGMRTNSLRPLSTCLAIDGDAKLRRPLDNVKELPEGHPK